jgi:hypothetical protein
VRVDPAEARDTAGRLVAVLAERHAGALRFAGVDLAPALEQQLFFALRDGRRLPTGIGGVAAGAFGAAAPLAASALGIVGRTRTLPDAAEIAVLVRDPTHYAVVDLVEARLQEIAGEALTVVRVGRAAAVPAQRAAAARLSDFVDPRLALAALAQPRAVRRALGSSASAWNEAVGPERAGELRRLAVAESGRIALGAAGLVSLVRRWRPSVLASFDEVGTWARLLPAVAREHGVRSVDLPHAEAADAVAIRGAGYDVMATYGPSASAVLRAAGIGEERIVEIGAPRLDSLIERLAAADPPAPGGPVVFAAQYVTGAMAPDLLRHALRAAVAAAGALGAEVVVVPHPAEPRGTAARLVAELAASERASLRVAAAGTLHEELLGARLLLTGWSNSVFEAAVAGVPAITVAPAGVAPVDFAADGLAAHATDPESAARAALALAEPEARAAAIARARRAAEERLGPLDGMASDRAARLLLSLAGDGRRRSAA